MVNENILDRLKSYIEKGMSKRGRLSIERIPYRLPMLFFLIGIIPLAIIIFFLALAYYYQNPVANLAVLLLVVQIIIVGFQTFNQFQYNKIAKIEFLPLFYISVREPKDIIISDKVQKTKVFLKNCKTNAVNISPQLYINKIKLRERMDLFSLAGGEEKRLFEYETLRFNEVSVKIVLRYEDVLGGIHIAEFRKDSGEVTFRSVNSGYYP